MIQRRSHLRFSLEAMPGCRVGQLVEQELDGNRAVQPSIECAMDHPHAPTPNDPLDTILAKLRTGDYSDGFAAIVCWKTALSAMRFQQKFHLSPNRRRQLSEVGRPVFFRQ
jgi:hypothetical protein